MKPKQIAEVILFVGVVGILGWLFWPKAAEQAGQTPLTAAGQPREPAPDAALAADGDGLAGPPALSRVDPATVQAALAALAQLQQEEELAKVRARSQDKAVTSNLRQLVQGAEQYFLEYGYSSVASAALVGTNSSQYVKTFTTVAGESYTATILQAHAVTVSGISGARTVTYAP